MADGGGWVVLGTAIGAAGSALTTWLNAYLTRKRPNPADEAAKLILRQMLEASGLHWQTIRTLSNVVGLSQERTRELLLEIGARGSKLNPELWGLVSRNPLQSAPGVQDPTLGG